MKNSRFYELNIFVTQEHRPSQSLNHNRVKFLMNIKKNNTPSGTRTVHIEHMEWTIARELSIRPKSDSAAHTLAHIAVLRFGHRHTSANNRNQWARATIRRTLLVCPSSERPRGVAQRSAQTTTPSKREIVSTKYT